MLNLFRLPFFRRKSSSHQKFPTNDIAMGVYRNFLMSNPDLTEIEKRAAAAHIAKEMKQLGQDMMDSNANRYDLIQSVFYKMENKLSKSTELKSTKKPAA